jgi:prepilin-type N-terminal cleavage/methylation domain-containing protein
MKRLSRFNLIELLVVIAIIAVLACILLPALRQARAPSPLRVCAPSDGLLEAPLPTSPVPPLEVGRSMFDVQRSLPSSPAPFAPTPWVLAALPLLLPIPGNRKQRRQACKFASINLRHGGPLVSRANEDTGATPQFEILDAAGNSLGMAGQVEGNAGQYQVSRANATTMSAATISPELTAFATGHPPQAYEALLEHFAPFVPAPVIFQYRAKALANQMGSETRDEIGASGVPSVVYIDPESMVDARLMFRGLETPFSEQDRQMATIPGNSVEMERQDRVDFLLQNISGGRAVRTYAAIQAAAGAATAVTIYTDADPFKALRTYLEPVILEAGSPMNVRIVMGYQVLNGFKDHPLANGTGAGLRQGVTDAYIAEQLGIPQANIMTSWHQVVESKQGKTQSKSVLIGATQMYIYVCHPTPNRNDNSWLKTFTLNTTPDAGNLQTYTHNPHPMVEMIGTKYWELLKNTNAATNAKKRLAITFATTATP